MGKIISISCFVLCLFHSGTVFADGDAAKAPVATQPTQQSANYGKEKAEFLPGEEVVTPTGKKVKVWSTRGPVPVSKAPEPFEDREKTVLPSGVIVEVDEDYRGDTPRQGEIPAAGRPAVRPQASGSFNHATGK